MGEGRKEPRERREGGALMRRVVLLVGGLWVQIWLWCKLIILQVKSALSELSVLSVVKLIQSGWMAIKFRIQNLRHEWLPKWFQQQIYCKFCEI